jgi:hypothetical protein
MTTLFSEISQYFAGNELRFPEKNLIYKENILINFTIMRLSHGCVRWKIHSLHLCEIQITYREGHFVQQNQQKH